MNLNALHQLGSFKRLFCIVQLKENYKICMKTHLQKAKFLAVNQFMEDAYFLHGYSKQGLPVNSKKHQWHPGYKTLGHSS